MSERSRDEAGNDTSGKSLDEFPEEGLGAGQVPGAKEPNTFEPEEDQNA